MKPSLILNQKKRHHYVPVTYLKSFADMKGRIYAYRKDGPFKPLYVRPQEIAFERYYYSQPLPEGGQDNNRLEDFFSTVESPWPQTLDTLSNGSDAEADRLSLFMFIGLMRARVPAARDAAEFHLANLVRRTTKRLEREGKIPPPPKGFESLYDDMQVSIDPHQSIHAMTAVMSGFARVLEHIGFEIIHNETGDDFVTSDNPVVYFDPGLPEDRMLPYTVRPPHGRIELFMPLTPRLLLRGRSELPVLRPGMRIEHRRMSSGSDVRRVNRIVAKFGYRFIFSGRNRLDAFVEKHSALSPGIAFRNFEVGDEEFDVSQMVFQARPKKPAWKRKVD